MKIVFAGVTLADPEERFPACGVAINGTLVYEAVQLVAASRQRLYDRGNELITVQFFTSREFDSVREAQQFAFCQWSALPKKGGCVITIGEGEDVEELTMTGAMLVAVPSISQTGVRVQTQYTLVAPGIDAELPGDWAEPEEDVMTLRGKEAITSGAESVTVAFESSFAAAPVVTVAVSKPASGGDNVWATLRGDLVTEDGFTVELSGPVSAEGYLLHWTAVG